MRLDDILKYKMTRTESRAFRLALLWETLCKQEYPNYRHTGLRKTGDPRKSNLFKYCYKLLRETKGILKDAEYRRYILAQLQVVKTWSEGTALIDPCLLTGEKAWRRWKLWRYHYNRRRQMETIEQADPTAGFAKVIGDLRATRTFLFGVYKGVPEYEQVDIDDLQKWAALGRLSPYYVLLSPWVARKIGDRTLDEVFINLDLHRSSITDEVRDFFKIEYNHEMD